MIRSQQVYLLKQIMLKFREVRQRAGVEDVVQELDQEAAEHEKDWALLVAIFFGLKKN